MKIRITKKGKPAVWLRRGVWNKDVLAVEAETGCTCQFTSIIGRRYTTRCEEEECTFDLSWATTKKVVIRDNKKNILVTLKVNWEEKEITFS